MIALFGINTVFSAVDVEELQMIFISHHVRPGWHIARQSIKSPKIGNY